MSPRQNERDSIKPGYGLAPGAFIDPMGQRFLVRSVTHDLPDEYAVFRHDFCEVPLVPTFLGTERYGQSASHCRTSGDGALMHRRLWGLPLLFVLLFGCNDAAAPRAAPPREPPKGAVASAAARPRQVFVDTFAVPGDQPAFALRGGRESGVVGVVFHGWCSHGMGFLQAFQWAAADVGQFIALQGDHHCGAGPMRGWSGDVVGLDRRIDNALRVYLGHEAPSELVLIGSSQGAERAVELARRFPGKYRWLVLSSGPHAFTANGLAKLGGAYLFVGQYEGRAPMQLSRDALVRAGLRAELKVVDGAGHADFFGKGDPLLREAFRFLQLYP